VQQAAVAATQVARKERKSLENSLKSLSIQSRKTREKAGKAEAPARPRGRRNQLNCWALSIFCGPRNGSTLAGKTAAKKKGE